MEISVPKIKFDEMKKCICGQQIAKGHVSNTVLFARSEYVIISGSGENGTSIAFVRAYQVVHLSKYNEKLKPLDYRMHFLEVDTGKREPTYNGMSIKHGRRALVFVGNEIHFHPHDGGTQTQLF